MFTSRQMVGTDEAARLLSVSRSTLARWIAEGKVPAIRIGRNFKLNVNDLKKLIIGAALGQAPGTDSSSPPVTAAIVKEVPMHTDELARQHQLWIEEMRARVRVLYSDKTIENYVRQFQRYLDELSAIIPLRGITIHDVIDVENVSRVLARIPFEQFSTRYQIYFAVVVFCRFLENRKLVDSRVREELRDLKPKRKGDPEQTFFRDVDQTTRFFQAIWTTSGNTYYDKRLLDTLCKTLDNTGMRRSELCDLLLSHVNFDKNEILVRYGKGGKSRVLGMNSTVRHSLKKYLKVRPVTSDEHFFVNVSGEKLVPEYVSKRIMRVSRRAGLKITTHSFRRTYATRLDKAGRSLPMIQGVLGHTTLTMASQYIKLQAEDVTSSMKAFEGCEYPAARKAEQLDSRKSRKQELITIEVDPTLSLG